MKTKVAPACQTERHVKPDFNHRRRANSATRASTREAADSRQR
jgi:hypothetical protein